MKIPGFHLALMSISFHILIFILLYMSASHQDSQSKLKNTHGLFVMISLSGPPDKSTQKLLLKNTSNLNQKMISPKSTRYTHTTYSHLSKIVDPLKTFVPFKTESQQILNSTQGDLPSSQIQFLLNRIKILILQTLTGDQMEYLSRHSKRILVHAQVDAIGHPLETSIDKEMGSGISALDSILTNVVRSAAPFSELVPILQGKKTQKIRIPLDFRRI